MPDLTRDAAAAATHARLLAAVLAAWDAGHRDPAALSAAAVVPVGLVKALLFEAGLWEPAPGGRVPGSACRPKPPGPRSALPRGERAGPWGGLGRRVRAALAAGPATAAELAAATGYGAAAVRVHLARHEGHAYRRVGARAERTGRGVRPVAVWGPVSG